MEVSRALLVPDFGLPNDRLLKSAVLIWESVDFPVMAPLATSAPSGEVLATIAVLMQEGVLRIYDAPGATEPVMRAWLEEAAAVADAWSRTPEDATAATLDLDIAEEIFVARGRRVARTYAAQVGAAMELAADQGLAPVDTGPFGSIAGLLPMESPGTPRVEAALIQLCVQGVVVDPATPLDECFRFRAKHRDLAGRLRGSLIDLAASIDADRPQSAVLSQAEAVIQNRVTPVLADLEEALKRSKLSFVWQGVLGVGGIIGGGATGGVTLGTGARAVGRAMHYAFDRDALIRQHPYGYLHQLQKSFGDPGDSLISAASTRPITNPEQELVDVFEAMYSASFRAAPRDEWTLRVVGERRPDPTEAVAWLVERALERPGREPWWHALPSRIGQTALPGHTGHGDAPVSRGE